MQAPCIAACFKYNGNENFHIQDDANTVHMIASPQLAQKGGETGPDVNRKAEARTSGF